VHITTKNETIPTCGANRRSNQHFQEFNMFRILNQFWSDEEGAAAIEYALVAALIAIAIVVGATLLGTNMNTFFTTLGTYVGTLTASVP
jgi:pilus assembly protein Flp/PilA